MAAEEEKTTVDGAIPARPLGYRITITRVEMNPEHVAMMKNLEMRGPSALYRNDDMYTGKRVDIIPREVEVGVLITELSEQQFKKIQPKIIEIFE